AEQLVGAQAQEVDDGGLQGVELAPRGRLDHEVVGAHQAAGAGDQLGDQACVAGVEAGGGEALGQREVRVGVLAGDLAQDIEGDAARVVHASTVPAGALRAQSMAAMRRLPAGCTSSSSSV